MAKLRITYTKSTIGYSKDQKDTIRSLGLRKLNSTAIHDDTPAIRGMVFKVRHLVKAEEIGDDVPTTRSSATRRATMRLDSATGPKETVDDLEVIEGIGPKIAGVLQAAGIKTFAQLAATDVAHLNQILQAAELRLAAPESWPEQAKLAASGDWDGLKELQDRLKGGRRT